MEVFAILGLLVGMAAAVSLASVAERLRSIAAALEERNRQTVSFKKMTAPSDN